MGAYPIVFGSGSTGVLQLLGQTITIPGLGGSLTSPGSSAVENGIASPAGTLVINNAVDYSYAGVIRDGTSSAPTNLVKTGAGTQTLSGNNTFTGTVAINGGVLQLGSSGALNGASPRPVSLDNSATLRLAGNAISVAGLTSSSANTVVENQSATAATLTVAKASGFDTFAGTLRDGTGNGTLSLNKTGPGTLELTGSNTFSGPITVAGGTLQGSVASLPTSITLAGTAGSPANVTFDQGQDATYAQSVMGPGSLTKAGAGTLTLGASQSYNGPTIINGGTLKFQALTVIAEQTLAMTGWNQDLIIGKNESAPTTTTNVASWDFYEAGYGPSQGLPADSGVVPRTFTSSYNPSVNFQFAPYAGNNAILNSGTLALVAPGKFQSIQILDTYQGTDGNPWSATLNFADGSSTTTNPVSSRDWTQTGQPGTCLTNYGLYNGGFYNNYLYMAEQDVTFSAADQAKVLQSITINGNGNLMVFAVSGSAAASPAGRNNVLPTSTPLVIAANSTLDLNGGTQQVASLSGAGLLTNSSTSTAAVFTVGDASSTTFSGSITDSGAPGSLSLTKVGGGALVLSGANPYIGGTTVNGGTLVLASNTAIADGTSLNVGANASSLFAGATPAVAPLAQGVAAVPEPGTLALLSVAGLVASAAVWRRRRN